MQEFIQMAVKQLGINEQQAKSATSGVLGLLQKNAPADAFSGVMNSVPGASDLLKGLGGNPGASSGGGGGLGGLLGAASSVLGGAKQGGSSILGAAGSLLGGKGGDALGALGFLSNSGLSLDKAGSFVNLLAGYLKDKAGAGTVDKLLGAVPELKKFIG
ncbi:MAG: DUF2780 domain-containing protein [Phycisphaerales bacterium]|nr:MAG: DUF2780 domain-containing protein [Phycisphaerales bacterium]